MTRRDRAALKLALALCRNESPGRAAQLDHKVRDEGWERAARFAAYCSQTKSLALPPWDSPPCAVSEDDDSEVDAEAVRLLRKMLAAGISKYHPDPLAALAEAKKKCSAET